MDHLLQFGNVVFVILNLLAEGEILFEDGVDQFRCRPRAGFTRIRFFRVICRFQRFNSGGCAVATGLVTTASGCRASCLSVFFCRRITRFAVVSQI